MSTERRVLLIEDDHWLADSYQQILGSNGFACVSVTEAGLAMKAIDDARPDLIIADVLLGDHTVIPLLHELQTYEDTRTVPVILCTAIATGAVDFSEQLRSYGVVTVLDKTTLTPEQLLATAREFVYKEDNS